MYFVLKEDYKKHNDDKALPSEVVNVLVQENQTISLIFDVL